MELKFPSAFGLYAILTDPQGYESMTKLFVDHRVAVIQLRMKKEPLDRNNNDCRETRAPRRGHRIAAHHQRLSGNRREGRSRRRAYRPDRPAVRGGPFNRGSIRPSSASPPTRRNRPCACNTQRRRIISASARSFRRLQRRRRTRSSALPGYNQSLSATVPAVAIGGIDLSNLREVLEAGAKNFCMVRQLMKAEDPEKVIKDTRKCMKG